MLKRAVRRNAERFPDDFMFVLDNQECATLRCQIGTSKLAVNWEAEKFYGVEGLGPFDEF
jgi:hypothetical protein